MADKLEPIEVVLIDAEGKTTRFRRSGALPDLFVSEKGTLLKANAPKIFLVGGHPTVKYKNTSLSLRPLVADAWMPGWTEGGNTTLGIKDGNKANCSVENLVPTSGGRGKPAGGAIKRQAQIYQCYKLTNDILLVAAEFDTSVEAVKLAISIFSTPS